MIKITEKEEQHLIKPHSFVGKPFDSNIKKDCKHLTTFTSNSGKVVDFFNFNNFKGVIGVNDNVIVYFLILEHFIKIKLDTDLKLVKVYVTNILPEFQRQGITTAAYQSIVISGTTGLVCSDFQTNPMSSVWKKLAQDSDTSDFIVQAFDKTGFFKENDQVINYNGANISEDKLWSTKPDISKINTFLLLKAKNVE